MVGTTKKSPTPIVFFCAVFNSVALKLRIKHSCHVAAAAESIMHVQSPPVWEEEKVPAFRDKHSDQ